MSDTNSWNYYGNTGALAVKSKYLTTPEQSTVPVVDLQPDTPNTSPPAEFVPSVDTNASEAPVDTNN